MIPFNELQCMDWWTLTHSFKLNLFTTVLRFICCVCVWIFSVHNLGFIVGPCQFFDQFLQKKICLQFEYNFIRFCPENAPRHRYSQTFLLHHLISGYLLMQLHKYWLNWWYSFNDYANCKALNLSVRFLQIIIEGKTNSLRMFLRNFKKVFIYTKHS